MFICGSKWVLDGFSGGSLAGKCTSPNAAVVHLDKRRIALSLLLGYHGNRSGLHETVD
jgi:hypothetical protein